VDGIRRSVPSLLCCTSVIGADVRSDVTCRSFIILPAAGKVKTARSGANRKNPVPPNALTSVRGWWRWASGVRPMIGNAALWIKSSGLLHPERRLSIHLPAKARRSRFERPERGGGRVWRVGTRSGYGSTGGRGILCGSGGGSRSRLRCGPDPALCEKHSHTVPNGRYSASDGTVYMSSLGGASG
jgi:hypothetical protein